MIEKKIENLNLETDLDKKLKEIEIAINEIEFEMNRLMESITKLKKEIFNKNMMIDFCVTLDLMENEKVSGSHQKRKKLNEDKLFILRKISISREKELDSIKDILIDNNILKNSKVLEYNELNKQLSLKKHELKLIKNQLMNHYHYLLSEGIDTRFNSSHLGRKD